MRILTLIVICLLSNILIGQSFSDSQKTLITKVTATWCPNCGTWGWDFAKAIEGLHNPNAVLIRAHYSGDLKSKVAEEIAENFQAQYQPEFYINETREEVGSTSWESKVADFKEAIEAKAEGDALVSLDIEGTIVENTITTSISVNALSDLSGEYFLATYLVEDGVVNVQSGQGSNTIHNGVVRLSMSGESFGTKIFDGSAESGSSTTISHSITLEDDATDGRQFRLISVVWKRINGKYLVENLHNTGLERSSNVQQVHKMNIGLKVHQEGNHINYSFDFEDEYGDAKVSLNQVDGRLLDEFPVIAKSGQQEIVRMMNNPLPQIVLVTISNRGKIMYSEKIFLE